MEKTLQDGVAYGRDAGLEAWGATWATHRANGKAEDKVLQK